MSWLSSVFHRVNVSTVLGSLGVGIDHPARGLLSDLLSSALPTIVEDLVKSLGGMPAAGSDLSTLQQALIEQLKALGLAKIERASDLTDDQIRTICAQTGGNPEAALTAKASFLQAEAAFLTPLLGA